MNENQIDIITKIINKTPHKINDMTSGLELEPAAAKDVFRTTVKYIEFKKIMGSTVSLSIAEISHDLPSYDEQVCYIVSKKVAEAITINYPKRDDFFFPAEVVYDTIFKNGKRQRVIVGCKGFVKY